MGEATLELLDRFPAYTEFLWEEVSGLVELRGRVLEIGAGLGAITRRILRSPHVAALDAVDVEPSYLERLVQEVADRRLNAVLVSPEKLELPACSYDRVVAINVLEHIADDLGALRASAGALRPGGQCAILVPAHPLLYSSLDVGLSHHRRYSRRGLIRLARQAGLEPTRVLHFNPLGALGWWLNGKVLGRTMLPGGQVKAYARLGIGLSRLLHRLNPFPLGISLIARLEKPLTPAQIVGGGGGPSPLIVGGGGGPSPTSATTRGLPLLGA